MKLSVALFGLACGQQALCLPDGSKSDCWSWHPPVPGDVRAPCPMLNTLANHAILPHNGQNITKDITVNALFNALNIDKALGEFLFNFAVTTNPQPNATTFNLDHLSRHNILEHDASLSRADFYFGNHDNHDFNQTVFDQTRSYWKGPIIDIQDAANARLARVLDSKAKNPTFTLSALGEAFGYGESAAYILVLGDRVKGQVKKAFVEYLFEHERLPVELGWRPTKDTITEDDLSNLSDRIVNATGAQANITRRMKVRDLHLGWLPTA